MFWYFLWCDVVESTQISLPSIYKFILTGWHFLLENYFNFVIFSFHFIVFELHKKKWIKSKIVSLCFICINFASNKNKHSDFSLILKMFKCQLNFEMLLISISAHVPIFLLLLSVHTLLRHIELSNVSFSNRWRSINYSIQQFDSFVC